jgi:hypothetical protein
LMRSASSSVRSPSTQHLRIAAGECSTGDVRGSLALRSNLSPAFSRPTGEPLPRSLRRSDRR